MPIKEHTSPQVSPQEVGIAYQRKPIDLVMILPPEDSPPLPRYIFQELREAFIRHGDTVHLASDQKGEKFPDSAKAAIRIDDPETRRRPSETLGRFPKENGGRSGKAITVAVIDNPLPDKIEDIKWLSRHIMGRKVTQMAIMIEGRLEDPQLMHGTIGVAATMEGNAGQTKFDPTKSYMFFDNIADRISFISSCEMVNKREGVKYPDLPLEKFCQMPAVLAFKDVSHQQTQAGNLWDTPLGEYGIDLTQQIAILRYLKQGGLGEGMLSALVDLGNQQVMSISETGTSKTDIDPYKGNVVAIPEFRKDGPNYWILSGWPKGHPLSFFRHPSWQIAKDIFECAWTTVLREGVKPYFKNIFRGKFGTFDHPPSIEGWENAAFYHLSTLLRAGEITIYEDYLNYLSDEFAQRKALPVIPGGLESDVNAMAHFHVYASLEQGFGIRVTEGDMAYFGYPHTPPCGSFEAASLILKGQIDLYQKYGPPKSKDEIRAILLPGHGTFFYGYNGLSNLSNGIIQRMNLIREIPKY